MTKNKILILGASGFIGNALYKELLSYFDVYGTYASQEGLYGDNQVFYKYRVEDDALDMNNSLELVVMQYSTNNS